MLANDHALEKFPNRASESEVLNEKDHEDDVGNEADLRPSDSLGGSMSTTSGLNEQLVKIALAMQPKRSERPRAPSESTSKP